MYNLNIKLPKEIPTYVRGHDARLFYENYCDFIDSNFEGDDFLKSMLEYNKGNVYGSNPYAIGVVNRMLRTKNQPFQFVSPVSLESILKFDNKGINLKNKFIETGLVLSGENVSLFDQYITEKLSEQLENLNIKYSKENPVLIPLNNLVLKKNPVKDDYYFHFYFSKDFPEVLHVSELNNYTMRFQMVNKHGVPISNGRGNRRIIDESNGSGLSVLSVNSNFDLCKREISRSYNPNGRILLTLNSKTLLESYND